MLFTKSKADTNERAEYTSEQKTDFHDPYKIVEHAKSIEDQVK